MTQNVWGAPRAVYDSWFTELLNKYVNVPLLIALSSLCTTLLTILAPVKCPWTKRGEAKPKTY
jgi:hypothetical protein